MGATSHHAGHHSFCPRQQLSRPGIRQAAARTGQHYQLGWLDCIGHDPHYPVTDCWPHLVDETIAVLSRYRQPVIGVGHSLGGYLLFYAAIRAPELFKALVILDSPLMGPRRAALIWLAKKLGLIARITPGGNTWGGAIAGPA
jgi:alpha-beta hydrolase superfamily lysophospholipase